MTAEGFLKNDNSYLIPHKNASIKGNQREAYEIGVKIGWQEATKTLKDSFEIPNNANLTDKEYKEIMGLISAFGYQFVYINTYTYGAENLTPGLNICKNIPAIKAGIVLSEEAKQKVIEVLKENVRIKGNIMKTI